MRYTRLLAPTLKEEPSDAEVASHRLLVRAGMIRQVARGIYDFLPLGLRVVKKVERIVRDELDRSGCQEVLLPLVSPAELWRESGRWDFYGKELLRIKDRHDREFCLGPTHEEVMTDLVRRDVRSYKQLPLNLYQIATKFRDEIRPRFGLMRGREFVMKDGYSFHAGIEDAEREYFNMHATYTRIFRRCGLEFRAVEADTGNIGGSLSHEFQVLATSGEDLIVACDSCEYAANVEKAEMQANADCSFGSIPLETVDTPDVRTIDEVSAFLNESPEHFIKTLICVADDVVIAALVRGDDQLSEPKLKTLLGAQDLRMAEEAEIVAATGAPQGFAGPVELSGISIVADERLRSSTGMATGANQADRHFRGVDQERDWPEVRFADLREARTGDACARCESGHFKEHRGIEVGHIFVLGTKYSEKLGATYLDADGNEQVMEMGTYGIGVTRTMAAAIEQNHDDAGIIWPVAIAPYEVLLVPVKWSDEESQIATEALYTELIEAGVEVLLDDRDERAGVKFNDADLIGIPFRVTIGPRGLKTGVVELKRRGQDEASELKLAEAASAIAGLVREAKQEQAA
ncbi:MAG: prolyl-tRNA synthetase [Hyphomicrobiaceae bacterium]